MQEKTKYRIAGSVVLLSVAAVVIPIFFENPVDIPAPLRGEQIPKNPQQPLFASIEFDPREFAKPAEKTPLTPPPRKEEVNVEAVDGRRVAEASALPAETEPETTENKAGDVRTPSTWWVQLGVFAQEANANSLRDKLREKKFATFIDILTSADGTRWRVMVGPELSRERAAAVRDRLDKETSLHGVLVRRE